MSDRLNQKPGPSARARRETWPCDPGSERRRGRGLVAGVPGPPRVRNAPPAPRRPSHRPSPVCGLWNEKAVAGEPASGQQGGPTPAPPAKEKLRSRRRRRRHGCHDGSEVSLRATVPARALQPRSRPLRRGSATQRTAGPLPSRPQPLGSARFLQD
ncbi:hypothetical protein J1605_009853 [Eschrichtius robustus]|uniref:Uncharacterized protein n=1 Tax=Eschrichtius robustus TaxID=9764 RepID=A0AB34GQS3_ESCRO|nr:hypothetical protein J1605_009853 [Eschrichtius robustus]